ncbi:MAG: 3-methyl-2-oxobutanoate hydroxymethyltransferase [Candidatus Electryonea clarkiae]|nr:3-methyl-2-oxobutanoate hydroxymethyltransferase [Candidatus Electryonea clarkiae]MDP8288662.1 3-methyl-2-oxobutanoate hydroxymethyltransferase [Candidatus Electryonea clarkiae]
MKSHGKITVPAIIAMKREKRKIVALTAYDATFASLEDEAGVDLILVGDSAGMVIAGGTDTLAITLDEMIFFTRYVRRGVKKALLVTDLPFGSFQVSPQEAIHSAIRAMKEGGAEAVKIEGGAPMLETISQMTKVGIPVLAHLGLTPQSVHIFGGYGLRGKKNDEAKRILDDAVALQEAGAFAIVLEKIPMQLAAEVTKSLEIPTIGIASGPECDGQILVSYDMLGLGSKYLNFKFVRRYMEGGELISDAVKRYAEDVRDGKFPTEGESWSS